MSWRLARSARRRQSARRMLTIHFRTATRRLVWLAEASRRPGAAWFAADQVVVPSAAVGGASSLLEAGVCRHGVCANVEFAYPRAGSGRRLRVVPGVGAGVAVRPRALLVWRLYDARLRAHGRITHGCTPTWRQPTTRRATNSQSGSLAVRPVRRLPAGLVEAWSREELFDLGRAAARCRPTRPGRSNSGAVRARAGAEDARAGVRCRPSSGAALVADATLPAELHRVALPAIAPVHLGCLQTLGACTEVHVYAPQSVPRILVEIGRAAPVAYLAAARPGRPPRGGNRLLWVGAQAKASPRCSSMPAASVASRTRTSTTMRRTPGAAGGDATLLGTPATRDPSRCASSRPRAPKSRTRTAASRSIARHSLRARARRVAGSSARPLRCRRRAGAARDPRRHAGPRRRRAADRRAVPGNCAPGAPHPLPGSRSPAHRAAWSGAVFAELPRARGVALHGEHRSACCSSWSSRAASAGCRSALESVRDWLHDAGVHWALDDAHCASLGFRPAAATTWRDRPARLLLGYALPTQAAELSRGTFRAAPPRAHRTRAALGALWRFVDALVARGATSRRPAAAGQVRDDRA